MGAALSGLARTIGDGRSSRRGGSALRSCPMTPMLPPSLPTAATASSIGGVAHAPIGSDARGGLDGAGLLRAEVEPEARGLGVQAHAERILAALAAPVG